MRPVPRSPPQLLGTTDAITSSNPACAAQRALGRPWKTPKCQEESKDASHALAHGQARPGFPPSEHPPPLRPPRSTNAIPHPEPKAGDSLPRRSEAAQAVPTSAAWGLAFAPARPSPGPAPPPQNRPVCLCPSPMWVPEGSGLWGFILGPFSLDGEPVGRLLPGTGAGRARHLPAEAGTADEPDAGTRTCSLPAPRSDLLALNPQTLRGSAHTQQERSPGHRRPPRAPPGPPLTVRPTLRSPAGASDPSCLLPTVLASEGQAHT